MSKIKNGGLDQYDEVYSLNGIGGERVTATMRRTKNVLPDDKRQSCSVGAYATSPSPLLLPQMLQRTLCTAPYGTTTTHHQTGRCTNFGSSTYDVIVAVATSTCPGCFVTRPDELTSTQSS